jgi:hypothetical protein
MHEVSVGEFIIEHVVVFHPFSPLKVTDIDVAGPLESCPITLHERRANQIIFVR